MALLEKQIEDVFQAYYGELISEDLEFVSRQRRFKGVKFDLLFKDRDGKTVVVELKRDAVSNAHLGQVVKYAAIMKDARIVLAAPRINKVIKQALDHFGLEYLEFDRKQVAKLHRRMEKGISPPEKPPTKEDVTQVIKSPLGKKRMVDGNIAFKVTYVDSGWMGVCSDRLYRRHIESGRVWCNEQAKYQPNCRSDVYLDAQDLDFDNFPCLDSVAMKSMAFSPGAYWHGKRRTQGIPCVHARVGKLMVFMSRKPWEPECRRFIFAIGQIDRIVPEYGIERFYCDPETVLKFEEPNYPVYWKYYKNPNAPEVIAMGSGLFRYWTDETARSLLNDIVDNGDVSDSQRELAKRLSEIVKEEPSD